MRINFALRYLALAFVFAFIFAGPVQAQQLYASIRGTVTDQTKAVIAGATITATNIATNVSRTVQTQADGTYQFLGLLIGTYNVSVSKAGFQTYSATGITLNVNQTYVQDATLAVGAATQQVMVEASSVQVETTTPQLGGTVSGNVIVDLPLNGRNWVQLQQMQPGVVASSDRLGNFATNGSESQQNAYLINGMDSNDIPLNTPLIIPSPDAISEFRIVTNTLNPEYGRNSGAIISAEIKQGTNQFHGDGFEFYRDTFLNDRSFFQRRPSIFHQNQFGGTVGGPIWKNHTFGFFSYQGTRAVTPQGGGNTPVFTSAQRGGAFGAGVFAGSSHASPIPLFGDSGSTCPFVSASSVPCAAGTAYSKLWASGSIPTQDFNFISTKLMNKFVPLPTPGAGNDFLFNPSSQNKQNQYLFRADEDLTSKDSIWFTGFFQHSPSINTIPFTGASLPGFASTNDVHEKQWIASYNHIFSQNLLNEFRVGYTRLNFNAVAPVTPTLPSSVGFQINPQDTAGAGLPVVNVTGLFSLGFSANGPQPRIDETYQVSEALSWVTGKHTLKFGYIGNRFGSNIIFSNVNDGDFGFGGKGPFSTGVAGADFLLGFPDTFAQGSGSVQHVRAYEHYFYVQDQYKIRPNFTLMYGSGYQINTPLTNLFNSALDINCFDPLALGPSKVFPSAPKGMFFPGDPGCTSSGYHTHYNDFGPRLGFAWSPNWGKISGGPGKMSIRGGYGIYYNQVETELTLQNLTAPPFSTTSTGVKDAGGDVSFTAPFTDIRCIDQNGNAVGSCTAPVQSIPNKFPFVAPAKGSTPNFLMEFGTLSLNNVDPNFRTPYSENYNLTVEREFPGAMILDVGYVGSVGRREEEIYELNPFVNVADCFAPSPNAALCQANFPTQNQVLPQDARIGIVYPGSVSSTFPFGQLVYGSVGNQATMGMSSYNSLQVSLNKHLSRGLTFLGAYTYSHEIDTTGGLENSGFGTFSSADSNGVNPFNFASNRGSGSIDARNRFVLTYDYLTPSLAHVPGLHWIPAKFGEGWHFSGITTFQSGFPLAIQDSGFTSFTCTGFEFYACWDVGKAIGPTQIAQPRTSSFAYTSNPSEVGTLKAASHYWFNPNSFTSATPGTFGNVGRGAFHGPGLNNWDMSLMKDTHLTENMYFELRMDFFNIFNHAQFTNPVVDVNDPNFGRIFRVVTGSTNGSGRIIQLGGKFYF